MQSTCCRYALKAIIKKCLNKIRCKLALVCCVCCSRYLSSLQHSSTAHSATNSKRVTVKVEKFKIIMSDSEDNKNDLFRLTIDENDCMVICDGSETETTREEEEKEERDLSVLRSSLQHSLSSENYADERIDDEKIEAAAPDDIPQASLQHSLASTSNYSDGRSDKEKIQAAVAAIATAAAVAEEMKSKLRAKNIDKLRAKKNDKIRADTCGIYCSEIAGLETVKYVKCEYYNPRQVRYSFASSEINFIFENIPAAILKGDGFIAKLERSFPNGIILKIYLEKNDPKNVIRFCVIYDGKEENSHPLSYNEILRYYLGNLAPQTKVTIRKIVDVLDTVSPLQPTPLNFEDPCKFIIDDVGIFPRESVRIKLRYAGTNFKNLILHSTCNSVHRSARNLLVTSYNECFNNLQLNPAPHHCFKIVDYNFSKKNTIKYHIMTNHDQVNQECIILSENLNGKAFYRFFELPITQATMQITEVIITREVN